MAEESAVGILACHVVRGGKPVAEAVVVSNRINVERKRFTLAHELAHRIVRSTGNPAMTLISPVRAAELLNQSLDTVERRIIGPTTR